MVLYWMGGASAWPVQVPHQAAQELMGWASLRQGYFQNLQNMVTSVTSHMLHISLQVLHFHLQTSQ